MILKVRTFFFKGLFEVLELILGLELGNMVNVGVKVLSPSTFMHLFRFYSLNLVQLKRSHNLKFSL